MRCFRPFPVVAMLFLSSCTFFALEEEVILLCPTPPVAWQIAFPRLGFRVVTWDPRGAPLVTEVADWRERAVVRCCRVANSPIVAWPYEPGNLQSSACAPGLLRPAGGFFPLSLRADGDRQVAELSWADGPPALVIARVAAEGRDISRFNVSRLCLFLHESRDPWSLDLDAVAQGIAQGEFSAWDIDPLPCRDAEVEPGPGSWFLESPFSPTFEANDGRILLPRIALGTHRLFALSGRSWTIDVGENECVIVAGTGESRRH